MLSRPHPPQLPIPTSLANPLKTPLTRRYGRADASTQLCVCDAAAAQRIAGFQRFYKTFTLLINRLQG
jgi:hypothetical protein